MACFMLHAFAAARCVTLRMIPVVLAVACALAAGQPASAQPAAPDDAFLIIDRDLNRHDGRIGTFRWGAEVGPAEVRVLLDDARRWESFEPASILAILRREPVIEPTDDGLVELADGTRLPGRPGDVRDGALEWLHPDLPPFELRQVDIRAIRFEREAPIPVADEQDVIVLRNGDRVGGFITSLGELVTIEMDDNVDADAPPSELQVPRQRIAALALVSVPTGPARSGRARAWLRDGAILNIEGLSIDTSGGRTQFALRIPGSSQQVEFELSALQAVVFAPRDLVALSTLSPRAIDGPVTRYAVPPPRVDAQVDGMDAPAGLSPLVFDGPVSVTWDLPQRRMWFATDVELPPAARTWGDVHLRIRCDDAVVFEQRLTGEQPKATVNVALDGLSLTIELSDAAGSPIQNTLTFHRPMLAPRR